MQDLNKLDTNITSKPAMVTDLDSSYLNKESYSLARNMIHASKEGNLGTLTNESSNLKCIEIDYTIVGSISLPDNNYLIFSTDNSTSEIGKFDEKTCTYEKLYTSSTLGFKTYYPPITGVAKHDFNKKTQVTFGNIKIPTRRIILEDLKSLVDEDTILLFKLISIPSISVERQPIGKLPNGTYSFAIAYDVDNVKYSDYYGITTRVQLYNEIGANSLEVSISNLDKEFEQYELIIIGNVNGIITAEKVGTYSTNIDRVVISSFLDPKHTSVPLDQLVIKNTSWKTAGIITANSNYLVLGDLTRREEVSYQIEAMNIRSQYAVRQVPIEYYEGKSENVGYYRDEVYDYYIEWLYKTGEYTNKFHIPGRVATTEDRSFAVAMGYDVYEFDPTTCNNPEKLEKWQVANTAGKMIYTGEEFNCNERNLGYGEMAFFESAIKYPDNPYLFGQYANTPIRYHKFPNENIVPRYSIIDGKIYINILGIKFSNIIKPDDPNIIGYRITRSDRDKTVIARGIFTNVRGYHDNQNNIDILYSNYPVNDLGPDEYLSETQTYNKGNNEKNYKPLTKVYNNKFNFYSPHGYFNEKYILGDEFIFETEEIGEIKGKFEDVFGHPQHKLLTQTSFWLALSVGIIDYAITLLGTTDLNSGSETWEGIIPNYVVRSNTNLKVGTVDELLRLDLMTVITQMFSSEGSLNPSTAGAFKTIITILQSLLATGLKVTYGALRAIVTANEIIDNIQKILGYVQYAKQFNGVTSFTSYAPITWGNRRRKAEFRPMYLSSQLHSIRDFVYNNFMREDVVFIELTRGIDFPKTTDESRFTISSAKICENVDNEVTKNISAYYGTSKVVKPEQYGSLGSSMPVITHNETLTEEETPIIYGGDCIIGRFQIMKKMRFFSQDLATEFGNELPPNFQNANPQTGLEYNYNLYRNIAYPRYWMDSTKYDFSQLLRKNIINKTSFTRNTEAKHNLDCNGYDHSNAFRVDNSYFYLYNNCVLDFIVEADYNINFRERGDNRHYSKYNKNLSLLYRPQVAQFPEKFELNKAFYNIQTTEIYNEQIREEFIPEEAFPSNQPNSIIYSLPSYNLQTIDNWQYFLPGNFFSFREGDFGKLVGINKLDQDRLIFTFSESSPFITMGRDFLTLDGTSRKITIGDGGLFAQDPREVMPTETSYGSTLSRYAFKNTHLGRFYPSVNLTQIFEFNEGIRNITEQGMYFWHNKYMPIQLAEYFPTYSNLDNPISGIGYIMALDATYELIYITKRDFIPKYKNIEWDGQNFMFYGMPISLRDSEYFDDISWTISYNPRAKAFVSFHDWHPDWIIQGNNHFMTVKNNTIWKHNERWDSFCNFYGKQYPFEIEFVSSSGQNVEIIKSLEYQLEAYKYKNSGRDKFHVFGENFDKLIVSNSEQISPLLTIKRSTENPYDDISYPIKRGEDGYDILFAKEENKYRINQFWDSVKDRGEFDNMDSHLFVTHRSGYKKIINPVAVDLSKPEEERKKFRHYWNKFWFSKEDPKNIQFIIKLFNVKKQISIK